MDAIRATSQQPSAERVKGSPPPGRYRPQARSEEATPASSNLVKPDGNEVRELAEKLAVRFNLKMEVVRDDKTGQDILKVMSPDGKRLLRQFPPEAVLALAERLRRGAADGLLTSLA